MKLLLLSLVYAAGFVACEDEISFWEQLCAKGANPPADTRFACFQLEKPIGQYHGEVRSSWGGSSAYKLDDQRFFATWLPTPESMVYVYLGQSEWVVTPSANKPDCVSVHTFDHKFNQEVCGGLPVIKLPIPKKNQDAPGKPGKPGSMPWFGYPANLR
ncbi:uncharacterized protein UTRI_05526_B [Ustilago trichophora]|uniref:Mig1 protein n=1 Tax=Ustilago trichophora TaxID=86804 RepID=A0A5C3EL78_9BASI|nr:uncharacterized protein UTRI_05526_B [Ustilago trichophora]